MKKIILFGIACIGVATLLFIDRWQETNWRNEEKVELLATSKLFETRLENAIVSRFSAVEALSSLFVINPETKPEEFASFARMLLKTNPPARAFQYANSATRVTYVYPAKGNEITIESPMTLLADSKRGPFVKKAIAQKMSTVQGPFKLRQGGVGLVVRSPIFLMDEFIGLAIGVYDVSILIEEAFAGIDSTEFAIGITDGKGSFFWGSSDILGNFQEGNVSVADTKWTIRTKKISSSAHSPILYHILVWLFGGGFLLSALLLIYFLWEQTQRLGILVEERTVKLSTALNEIKTLYGIIPICMYCKEIRDDKGSWNKLEKYIVEHSQAEFSHGICPDCMNKEMEKLDKEDLE